ncbi:hypothetical protein RRG08_023233 [Elysia crispata]|uniref:Uncharacterized protein n=1 Tax=Elysia crispata TaxID=231223 RepID=A0AAE1DL34_9GAST|nr:hypothetical protein RRG08_023233 [Elysia crispata]
METNTTHAPRAWFPPVSVSPSPTKCMRCKTKYFEYRPLYLRDSVIALDRGDSDLAVKIRHMTDRDRQRITQISLSVNKTTTGGTLNKTDLLRADRQMIHKLRNG